MYICRFEVLDHIGEELGDGKTFSEICGGLARSRGVAVENIPQDIVRHHLWDLASNVSLVDTWERNGERYWKIHFLK